jgi:hypothetical protein
VKQELFDDEILESVPKTMKAKAQWKNEEQSRH